MSTDHWDNQVTVTVDFCYIKIVGMILQPNTPEPDIDQSKS